jgi:hypothetical protein
MPIRKKQVKQKTRVDKINRRKVVGRLKSTELTGCGKPKHMGDAAQVSLPCVSQSRRATNRPRGNKGETWEVTPSVFAVSVKNSNILEMLG